MSNASQKRRMVDSQKDRSYFNTQDSRRIEEPVGADVIDANYLMNIGLIFEKRGEPERAMHYYKTALKHFQQNLDEKGIARCVNNIEGCAAKLKWLTFRK